MGFEEWKKILKLEFETLSSASDCIYIYMFRKKERERERGVDVLGE